MVPQNNNKTVVLRFKIITKATSYILTLTSNVHMKMAHPTNETLRSLELHDVFRPTLYICKTLRLFICFLG